MSILDILDADYYDGRDFHQLQLYQKQENHNDSLVYYVRFGEVLHERVSHAKTANGKWKMANESENNEQLLISFLLIDNVI